MNYLGLDYGQKHLGVAISNGLLTEPLTTLNLDSAPGKIARLVEEHRIGTIIIGLPEGPVRAHVEEFVHTLKHIGLPVVTADETLSSRDAIRSLHHTSKSRRRTKEHSVAAALILQNWLDNKS